MTSERFELLALPAGDWSVVLSETTHGVVPCCSSVPCSSQCAHLTKRNYIISFPRLRNSIQISLLNWTKKTCGLVAVRRPRLENCEKYERISVVTIARMKC